MNRVRFKVACGVLAACVGVAAVAVSADAQTPGQPGTASATGGAAAGAQPVDEQPGAASIGEKAAGEDAAGAQAGARKRAGKKRGAKKKAAANKRKARKAAEARKKADAEKAAAAKRAATPSKKSSPRATPPARSKPVVVQTARIAAAGPLVIGKKAMVECHLQTLLPAAVARRASVLVLADRPAGTVLSLKITEIQARGGGFLSGPKALTVEGRLMEGARVRGSFTARQSSFGAVGSCAMLEKVIDQLAGDIGAWLRHPAMDSRLGK